MKRMATLPLPVVRYMIVCDDLLTSQARPNSPIIVGLIANISAEGEPRYPFTLGRLCVLVVLTEGRGAGRAHLRLVLEETGQTVWVFPERELVFPPDPLEVHGVIFRILDCRFPQPGLYNLEFIYEGQCLAQQSLRLR
jgi:hypothetical protein